MTMSSERAKFSLSEGRVEIEGSEAFVSEQLTKLQPLMAKMFQQVASSLTGEGSAKEKGDQPPASEGLQKFENLFALADGKIQILKDLPGTGKAQKSVNAALLLAYANFLQGINTVGYDTVRNLCAAHACLDSTNFSKSIKGEKEYFIATGNGSAQTIALTIPGRRKAAELATSLNA